ncbi:sugar phosphate isomerase/epimerase [Spongiivirga sp. MCCC 1A20706]|uniref:sugar phosphate isomerase/epimerase family protein n=1 Tax=Spongiivirga sp. MCCC 1A20706 TaxID=3160963 RepID=UPI003977292E
MNRREAIKHTALATGALAMTPSLQAIENLTSMTIKNINFGVQLFTIPSMVEKDLKGTLQLLSDIGYKEIEFFGPYPFSSDVAKQGFDQMKQMLNVQQHAFYGYETKVVKTMLDDFGLSAPSVHVNIDSLRTHMTALLDGLAPLDTKYVVLPILMDGRASLDDYKKRVDEFNGFGEQMAKYNMKFVYHNHGYEHKEMNGQVPLQYLIDHTDQETVQFELDIFWMAAAGADPVEFLKANPGRFKMLHLKDAASSYRFSKDGGTPDQWMAGFPKMADPGDGIFDIKLILEEAIKSGVDHFYLERDLTPTPMDTLKNSFKNLSSLQ